MNFGRKKEIVKKPVVVSSVESETIWREVNLFWPETIAITIAVLISIGSVFFTRVLSSSGLEAIKPMLSEQGYVETAGLIMNMNSLFILAAAVPLLILGGFYAYRLMVFTPRGNKHMVARFKRTGGLRISVDTIKNNELPFDSSSPLSEKMTINNPRKHWLENLGKPFIVLFEGDDCNADLNQLVGNVSSKSKDTTTINDMSFQDGRRFERMNMEEKTGLLTATNVLLILILAGIAITIMLMVNNPAQTAELLKNVPIGMVF